MRCHPMKYALTALGLFLITSSATAQLPARDEPYVADLVNLSETLGRAHAIRVLCNGRDDQQWREYMRELLDLEAPAEGFLRSRMIQAFNTAYGREELRYYTCDRAARDAESQHVREGRALAETIADRYLPPSD